MYQFLSVSSLKMNCIRETLHAGEMIIIGGDIVQMYA